MPSRIRAGLSYSNVMSTIAVFLALGGGAAYATSHVTGDDVADESLTGADIRGSAPTLQQDAVDGTLETWDIKNGSIFTVDIADETLGPADIALVTGAEVGTDALDGSDIQNLTGSDIANDSLDGFDIHNLSGGDLIDGSVGPEDLAPGTAGFGEVITRHRQVTIRRGQQARIVSECPAGWQAVGGGYNSSQRRDPDDLAVAVSDRFGEDAWIVIGKHVGGLNADRITLQASVNCLR